MFFARVSPDSTVANPRCMTNTRNVATIIHRLFTVNISTVTAGSAAAAGSATSCPKAPAAPASKNINANHTRRFIAPSSFPVTRAQAPCPRYAAAPSIRHANTRQARHPLCFKSLQ